MCPEVTEDDIGKTVKNAEDMAVGNLSAVDGSTLYVDADPGLVDSIKAAIGWETDQGDATPIPRDAVREVTDGAILLEPTSRREGHDSVTDRDEGSVQRSGGAQTGETEGAAKTDGDATSDASEERQSKMDDAPPEGDRTVTKGRGKREDR